MSSIEIYKKALAREKIARKMAEKIIEDKSSELYNSNQELIRINKSVEKEVRARTKEIQDLFDNMYDGYITLDSQGVVTKSNKAARVILGYSSDEEIAGLSLKDIVHEDDLEHSKKYIELLLKQGYYNNYVGRVYDAQRNIKYLEINSNAIYDADNNIIGSRDIIRDVTQKKMAEQQLALSEERMRAVFDNKSVGIAIFNGNGGFVSINETFQQQLGHPEEYFMTKVATRILHPEDIKKYRALMDSIYKNEVQEAQVESRYLRKSGEAFWANSNISGVYNDQKNLVYYIVMVEDITAKKIAEEQLRLQEEKYRNIIANMNLGLLEVDTNDKVQYANQGFVEMSGFTLDEMLGKEARTLLMDVTSSKTIEEKTTERQKGKSDAYELYITKKDKSKRWWLISGAPKYNDKGELVGSIGIHLDITEQKETQSKLQNSMQSLELANQDLKDFAHVVSHDLKAPLRSISGLIQILQEDYRDKFDEDGQQIVEDVINRTEHMDELIGGILSYSSVQKSEEKKTFFHSKDIIDKLLKYIEFPQHISLEIEGDFPSLNMNPTHFQQLIQNFITNAIKYNDKEQGKVKLSSGQNDKFYYFAVQDNGRGIDQRNQEKIFNMFQKFDAEGKSSSGIGLAIVKKIVELYQGKVSLQSEVGEGSTFTFYLPKN